MENIYDDFINIELKDLYINKKLKIDEIYRLVEMKLNTFIPKNKNEYDVNKFKIILTSVLDSFDSNLFLNIPSFSISIMALIFSVIPINFNYDNEIFYILRIFIVSFILFEYYMHYFNGTRRSERKKLVLNICLALISKH